MYVPGFVSGTGSYSKIKVVRYHTVDSPHSARNPELFCPEMRSGERRVWYPEDQGHIALQDAIFQRRIPPYSRSFSASHSNLAGRETREISDRRGGIASHR